MSTYPELEFNRVMFSSQKEEWETPQPFFDELDKEFNFTLDPCATFENKKCERFFSKEKDGLLQDWGGETVFCNPPYGSKKTADWIKKCAQEGSKPNTTVVLLIPVRTDTRAFHDFVYKKAEIRFIRGRLKFGNSVNTAPFPSMVVIFNGSASN